jgi:hypothetical protein
MLEFASEAVLDDVVEEEGLSTGAAETFMVVEFTLAGSFPTVTSSPTLTLPQPFSLSSSVTCTAFL